MSIKQISVFLENRPGKLKEMTAVLAAHDIDMRALSLAETKDFGIARIIVDDAFDAANVLKENGFVASLTSVLAVEVEDVPGGLDKVLNYFANANVNIEYMYAFTGIKNPGHEAPTSISIPPEEEEASPSPPTAAPPLPENTEPRGPNGFHWVNGRPVWN